MAAITRFHLDSKLKLHPILHSKHTESVQLSASPYHLLPLADAVVYATARKEEVEVVTSDSHFKDLDDVVFLNRGL